MKTKVVIFTSMYFFELERLLNDDVLPYIHNIVDIKYSSAYCPGCEAQMKYSAMIIYVEEEDNDTKRSVD